MDIVRPAVVAALNVNAFCPIISTPMTKKELLEIVREFGPTNNAEYTVPVLPTDNLPFLAANMGRSVVYRCNETFKITISLRLGGDMDVILLVRPIDDAVTVLYRNNQQTTASDWHDQAIHLDKLAIYEQLRHLRRADVLRR